MTKEEFNALVDRYLSGQASPDEERLIDDFFYSQGRKNSLEHYGLANEMWAIIDDRIRQKRVVNATRSRPSKTLFRTKVLVAATIAAIVCMAVGVVFLSDFADIKKEEWTISEVPYGQKAVITLWDGSRVFLNAGSRISYPTVFAAEKREVKLSGEAFFEVTKDASRPFVIESEGIVTQVLGTAFNIQAFPNMPVQVTVASGRVQVEAKPEVTNSAANVVAEPLILTRNQQATYDPVKKHFEKTEADTTKLLAWRHNTIYFEDASMEQAAVELERWFNVSIEFEEENIKYCLINGQYKDQSLINVLKSFQHIYHIDYKFSDQNKIVLYGKGCN